MAELAIARKHFPLHGLIVFIVHTYIIYRSDYPVGRRRCRQKDSL